MIKIGVFEEYKGYIGTIELNGEKFSGYITNSETHDTYKADSIIELELVFHMTVDNYIKRLKSTKKEEEVISKSDASKVANATFIIGLVLGALATFFGMALSGYYF